MRRSLVLGDEHARHPFLQTLPPHVRAGQPMHPLRAVEVPSRSDKARKRIQRLSGEAFGAARRWGHAAFAATKKLRSRKMKLTSGDSRDFLLAYCACFLAASAFIA